ncbi:hypothetical protein FACS1894120_5740 [Clostridia bacterium]|nr:hypothetical protein FACS1894120_5740 [Clostridia bacterium]
MTFNYGRECLSHLPSFLREYPEFQSLCSYADSLVLGVWEYARFVLEARFVYFCDAAALARYEDMLSLTPAAGDTLQLRRTRVALRLTETVPINYRMLREQTGLLCGHYDSAFSFDRDSYTLTVMYSLDGADVSSAIYDVLRRLVPAAVAIEVKPRRNTHGDLSRFTRAELSEYTYHELMYLPRFRTGGGLHSIG